MEEQRNNDMVPMRSSSDSEMVELNVGGVIHVTTYGTLRSVPGSMLANAFDGRFKPGTHDRKGRVFIDRDGHRFAEILNYLRTGNCWVQPDLLTYSKLAEEADFYGLVDLSDQLKRAMLEMEKKQQHDKMIREAEETGGAIMASHHAAPSATPQRAPGSAFTGQRQMLSQSPNQEEFEDHSVPTTVRMTTPTVFNATDF